MLPPEYLAGAADGVVEIYAQVENDIMADITRRVVKTGEITETAAWQIERAREFGYFQEDVAERLAAATGRSRREINRMMNEAAKKSLAYDDAIYRRAGRSPPPIGASPALQATLLQGRDTTMALLGNFTKTAGTASTAAFSSIMDRAFLQTMTGAFDINTAIRNAVRELARNDVLTIAYPSGAHTTMEAAVRRAVLTGTNQAVAKLQIQRASDMRSDLVETTAHAGARPTHAVWQGQIFSLSGKTRGYQNFYDATGYGSGDGLCGYNCYHNFYPFFEGISTPSFGRDPSAAAGRNNDQDYENGQQQRAYERAVREAKRECVVYKTAMDEATTDGARAAFQEDFTRASVKLKRREARLAAWVKQTDGNREREREAVAGFDRSVSSRAVWANKKAGK